MEPVISISMALAVIGLFLLHVFRGPKESHNELSTKVELLYHKHYELEKTVASHNPLMIDRTERFDRSLQGLTHALDSLRDAIEKQFSQLRDEIHDLRPRAIGKDRS